MPAVSATNAGGGEARLQRRLKITLAAAAACGLLLSWRLWVSSPRQYPTVPVSRLLPPVPYPLDFVWLAALLALLAAVALARESRKFVVAFLVLAGLLCLWDQSRWQPWFYMYYFMLLALCIGLREGREPEDGAAALNTCRLIVAATYFWGGLQKVNYEFATLTVRSLLNPYLRHLPEELRPLTHVLAVVIPLAEICVGAGLLTRRFRDAAVVCACLMHAFVLMLFVPVRNNVVIWPWNVAMAAVVVWLFWRDRSFSLREVLSGGRLFAHKLALALFGVMPLLGLFGLWDSYLSAALYSGNTHYAAIYVSDSLRERLPPKARGVVRLARGRNMLNIGNWSYAELNVPPYPEPRVYREAGRTVCRLAETPTDAVLEIHGRPNPLDGRRTIETWDCDRLNTAISD
ncbi:MAG TPA: MauE/DoxX family redox-associated membrane protein [Pyrinomonadaceae bacterium]